MVSFLNNFLCFMDTVCILLCLIFLQSKYFYVLIVFLSVRNDFRWSCIVFLFMFVFHQKENICIIEEWKSVARNEDYLTSRLQGNSSLHLSAEKEPDLDFDMNIEKRLFFCGFFLPFLLKIKNVNHN